MTSKNSFWASSRENQKRRIWVWIVAVLSQLLAYGAITMIYLSRIQRYHAQGAYKIPGAFQEAMYQATKDALGFSDNIYGVIFLLSAIIGMQGFSYLYDRRKVDLYHSVPVAKSRRFAVVYLNGLFIYLAANLSGLFVGMVIAASQNAVNASVLADAGLAFLWNLFLFLVCYHTMILAVMITGNRFVTIGMFLAMMLYEVLTHYLTAGFKRAFFRTFSTHYIASNPKLSVLYDYTANVWRIKNQMTDTAAKARYAFPLVGKWALIAAALFALAYLAYRKRPSEAAGKAIAFRILEPVIKVTLVIPAALTVGGVVYDTSFQNELLEVLGMAAAGVIFCAVAEVLYDFDIRSLFKHLPSSGIALIGILAIFCIFKWDLSGYDSYIPAQNKVESIAISADGYYDNYWDENLSYIDSGAYEKEHMFLTDTEPVLALAQKYREMDEAAVEEMSDDRNVQILYRLKSGRMAARAIRADYDDPETAALLNRIFRTDAFKKGVFQAMNEETAFDRITGISYTNGAVKMAVPIEEAVRLRQAWIEDMTQFDFKMARQERPCGALYFEYDNYTQRQWFVYDSFENTIALLKEQGAYYPMQLNAEDVANITVTCYHTALMQADEDVLSTYTMNAAVAESTGRYVDYTVRETFYEEEQIAQILPNLHASYLNSPWGSYEAVDNDYSVEVVFKKDTSYPYQRDSYYFNYNLIGGQVPDFVVEATAYTE